MNSLEQKKVEQPKHGKELTGEVVSTKMNKTVVVEVVHIYRHPLYRKAMRKTKKFLAENVGIDLKVGDRVKIVETMPISKRKHFRVVEKIS